ncbi:hypothetical protein D3C72_2059760 [compost metagenome]
MHRFAAVQHHHFIGVQPLVVPGRAASGGLGQGEGDVPVGNTTDGADGALEIKPAMAQARAAHVLEAMDARVFLDGRKIDVPLVIAGGQFVQGNGFEGQ